MYDFFSPFSGGMCLIPFKIYQKSKRTDLNEDRKRISSLL